MKREWQPGDVAVVDNRDSRAYGLRVMRCVAQRGDEKGRKGWALEDTDGTSMSFGDRELRPLVVIDPEDREQVERLWRHTGDGGADDLQEALREYANPTPPKPNEPMGLGSLVEDASGRKYVRVAQPFDGWMKDRDWQQIGGDVDAVRNFGWSSLDVVRVLGEGVIL